MKSYYVKHVGKHTFEEHGVWRTKTNQEMKKLDLVADIKRRRLELLGDEIRMHQKRVTMKMFENKPKGKIRAERLTAERYSK
jgi:hypothetical protein